MAAYEARDMFHTAMPSVGPAWAIMSWTARLPHYPPSVASKRQERTTSREWRHRFERSHLNGRGKMKVKDFRENRTRHTRQRNSLANVMCEQDFFKRRETALDKLTLCDSREWVTNRLISQLKSWKIQKSSACKFMTNTDLRSCLMKRGQTSSHHDMSAPLFLRCHAAK